MKFTENKFKSACIGIWTVMFGLAGCTSKAPEAPVATLFTAVSPEQTNIRFENQVIDQEDYNTLFHANFYGGGGVAIGDINNDGLQDIYFTGNQVSDRLYLNKGELAFEDITKRAGIEDDAGWSSGVLMGDVNNDGYLDIYVAREMYGSQPDLLRNRLYINNKDQTFTEASEAWGIDNAERSRGGTFFDYDNDGDLDLYLLNTPPNPGPLVDVEIDALLMDRYTSVLYENLGSRFENVTQQAGLINAGFPNSVVAADLNDDGFQDLYVTHDFTVPDCIYMNNGNGTFTNQVNTMTGHISFGSMGVDAADINNDGLLDLFVTDMSAEDNYRIKANMSGMNPEAFWQVVDRGDHHQYMYNTLQLNTGSGRFSDVAQLAGVATTDWSWSSFFADFDNDGLKDAFVSNGILRDIRYTDALKKLSEYVNKQARPLAINHMDKAVDFKIDAQQLKEMVDLFPSEKLLNYAYKNNGDYTFTKKMEDWGITSKTFSNGSAYGDLDNDGDLDLVINNINDIAQVLENHAVDNGAHYLRIKLSDKAANRAIFGAKISLNTNDGTQFFEITGTRGMYSSSEQLAHFGLGDNSVVNWVMINWPDGKQQTIKNPPIDQTLILDYGDAGSETVDARKKEDPFFTNVTEQLDVEIMHHENDFDDYELQVLLPHKMSTYGPGLAHGDVDGNGYQDFYLGGAAGYPGQLILQTSEGKFQRASGEVFHQDKDFEDIGAAFFDADADGDLDLYVVSGGNEFPVDSEFYQDRLYINEGNSSFSNAVNALPELRISGSKVRPNDFDNDGDLDLFIAGHHIPADYPAPASSALLLNQEGKFTDVTERMAPGFIDLGLVNDAAWVDFDDDGRQDLVLAGEWMPVTLFRNDESGFTNVTEEMAMQNTTGWWFSITTADMDNDGDQDLIAGNLGLNYKYKATPEEPFKVYYDDFDLNGSKDIVLAYYNFGGLFPLRGRSCSSEQVPQLSDKFKTYDLFAQSDIASVYGTQNLENALEYQVTSFATTYYENLGDGQFKPHPLPMEAQFSSVNDIVIRDLNKDNNPDIIIAGNLYHAEVETPRNDAGYSLMLLGQGDGSFKPLSPRQSGLFLPFDVKSLTFLDGTSNEYLLVGSNNDKVQVLKTSN